jgi:hypothetical protein
MKKSFTDIFIYFAFIINIGDDSEFLIKNKNKFLP